MIVVDGVILPPHRRVVAEQVPWQEFGLMAFPPPMHLTPARGELHVEELVAGEWVRLVRLPTGTHVSWIETDRDGEQLRGVEAWAC